jgi:hypothetical protein
VCDGAGISFLAPIQHILEGAESGISNAACGRMKANYNRISSPVDRPVQWRTIGELNGGPVH